jgi:hypothetical protein
MEQINVDILTQLLSLIQTYLQRLWILRVHYSGCEQPECLTYLTSLFANGRGGLISARTSMSILTCL